MPEETNVNGIIGELTNSFVSYGVDFIEAVPTLLIAAAVLVGFIILAGIIRNIAETLSERVTDDKSLQSLFGTMARVLVLVVGIFAAAGVLFPGLSAGDLVGVLGLSSVAIGFAFKDIFQNFLAGILILAQRPFQIDDQIEVSGYEGTVEDITIRSTYIRTYGGERVLIPNSTIYNSPITVRTAFDQRRTVFGTGIGYDEDIEEGREVILEALRNCDQVAKDPAPQVYVSSHGDSSVNFDCRYWTASRTSDVRAAQNEVATAVKYALDEADIEIPYPHRTVEFFDMSDAEGASAA
jgi:small-conductance mechanosensitive channel